MIGKTFFQFLRVIFFVLLSVLIVYLYYLHTKEILLSKLLALWKSHHNLILIIAAIIVYSLSIFYLGVKKGRKG